MRHDEPELGKFEGNGSRRLSTALYNITMDGLNNTELGDVENFGWYGLIRRRKHGYIVHENFQGFFDYTEFKTLAALDKAWSTLESEYEEFCGQEEPYV